MQPLSSAKLLYLTGGCNCFRVLICSSFLVAGVTNFAICWTWRVAVFAGCDCELIFWLCNSAALDSTCPYAFLFLSFFALCADKIRVGVTQIPGSSREACPILQIIASVASPFIAISLRSRHAVGLVARNRRTTERLSLRMLVCSLLHLICVFQAFEPRLASCNRFQQAIASSPC